MGRSYTQEDMGLEKDGLLFDICLIVSVRTPPQGCSCNLFYVAYHGIIDLGIMIFHHPEQETQRSSGSCGLTFNH